MSHRHPGGASPPPPPPPLRHAQAPAWLPRPPPPLTPPRPPSAEPRATLRSSALPVCAPASRAWPRTAGSLPPESRTGGDMAKSRFEYVKQFELDDRLLPDCWLVVRLDGKAFTKCALGNICEYSSPVAPLHLYLV